MRMPIETHAEPPAPAMTIHGSAPVYQIREIRRPEYHPIEATLFIFEHTMRRRNIVHLAADLFCAVGRYETG